MTELEQRLGLRDAEGKLLPISSRDANILRHYEQEIAKGRMTLNTATSRAKHDFAGNNGHPERKQRG